jgi:hypothetical protein
MAGLRIIGKGELGARVGSASTWFRRTGESDPPSPGFRLPRLRSTNPSPSPDSNAPPLRAIRSSQTPPGSLTLAARCRSFGGSHVPPLRDHERTQPTPAPPPTRLRPRFATTNTRQCAQRNQTTNAPRLRSDKVSSLRSEFPPSLVIGRLARRCSGCLRARVRPFLWSNALVAIQPRSFSNAFQARSGQAPEKLVLRKDSPTPR